LKFLLVQYGGNILSEQGQATATFASRDEFLQHKFAEIIAQKLGEWVQVGNFNNAPAFARGYSPLTRQTVMVLIYNQKLLSFAMILREGSVTDGRYNQNPVQDEIQENESLFNAAVRAGKEKIAASFSTKNLVYLGSMLQPAPQGRKDQFDQQNFHVCLLQTEQTAFVVSKSTKDQVNWVKCSDFYTCVYPYMSYPKAAVVSSAIQAAKNISGSQVPYYA